MEYRTSTVEQIREFSRYLREEERETATIDKYSRDVKDFFIWLKDREISRERIAEWKQHLRFDSSWSYHTISAVQRNL